MILKKVRLTCCLSLLLFVVINCGPNEDSTLKEHKTTLRTTQAGLDLIKRAEGFQASTYICPGGKPSIGYGHQVRHPDHKIKNIIGDRYQQGHVTLSKEEAEQLLITDLKEREHQLNQYNLNLSDNQFDALICWIYNLGIGNFRQSTLLKRLQQLDANASDQLCRWNKSNGSLLQGLLKRRFIETMIFCNEHIDITRQQPGSTWINHYWPRLRADLKEEAKQEFNRYRRERRQQRLT